MPSQFTYNLVFIYLLNAVLSSENIELKKEGSLQKKFSVFQRWQMVIQHNYMKWNKHNKLRKRNLLRKMLCICIVSSSSVILYGFHYFVPFEKTVIVGHRLGTFTINSAAFELCVIIFTFKDGYHSLMKLLISLQGISMDNSSFHLSKKSFVQNVKKKKHERD